MQEFTISPEFRDLLPKLSSEEHAMLLSQINADGCRDPLVVWQEEGILIDGHNRYSICNDLELPYTTVLMSFKNRDDVKMWMFRNQLGRRNLDTMQRAEIAVRMLPVIQDMAKSRQSAAGGDKVSSQAKALVEPVPQALERHKAARDIAGEIAGVSGRTVDKVKKILAEATPEVIAKVRNKEMNINEACETVAKKREQPVVTEEVPKANHNTVRGFGVEIAHEAINVLKKIPNGDPLGARGFQIVATWIKQNPFRS